MHCFPEPQQRRPLSWQQMIDYEEARERAEELAAKRAEEKEALEEAIAAQRAKEEAEKRNAWACGVADERARTANLKKITKLAHILKAARA